MNELFRACADAEKISERLVNNYQLYVQQENLIQNEKTTQKETESADEAVYHIDQESYLYVQTSEEGYDYTLYDRFFKEIDGGQLDIPIFTIEAARDEILALHEISPKSIVQIPIEEYERLPELIGKEPTVIINYSESDDLENGSVLPFTTANHLIKQLDKQTREQYGKGDIMRKQILPLNMLRMEGYIHTMGDRT